MGGRDWVLSPVSPNYSVGYNASIYSTLPLKHTTCTAAGQYKDYNTIGYQGTVLVE